MTLAQSTILSQLFWSHWKREHIRTLEKIKRLNQPKRNPQVGDIVLVKDENTPRTIWTTGRGIFTEPDNKVFVRRVILKTQTISKL